MDLFGGIKKFFDSKHTATNEEFEAKGFLSPEQFVEAGDQLTNFGWKWEKALSKPSKVLPPNKQFMSSQATSRFRIKSIHNEDIGEEMVDGFLVPTIKTKPETEEDYRIYKVYITYDEYYHTPRLWLTGNDKQGRPLNSKQIFEDIIAEYQNETVTEETHPYLGNAVLIADCRMVTVHPCKHSDVMKNFVDEAKKHGKKIKAHQALMIFLKFMSSVMPTVCFDSSIDIEI